MSAGFGANSNTWGFWVETDTYSRSKDTGGLPSEVLKPQTAGGVCITAVFSDELFCRKVVTIAKSKKFRDHHGQVLLEGQRLIKDALEAGAVLRTLFFSTVGHLKELPEAELKRANLVKVKFEDIKTWSDLVTPQGLIGKLPWKQSQRCSKGNLFHT